jgi:hypothetical protein
MEFSTIPVDNIDFCSDLPSWQSEAVTAVMAATKHKQIALDSGTCLLLTLWCFLDGSPICIDAMERWGKTQDRWATGGELQRMKPGEVGINHTIADLSSNTDQLNASVQALLTHGALIRTISRCDGLPAYALNVEIKGQIVDNLSSEARVLWKIQASIVVAFAFPRPNINEKYESRSPQSRVALTAML